MHARSKNAVYSNSAKVTKGVWILLAALVLGVWVPAFSYMAYRSWRDSRPDTMSRIDLASGHNFIYDVERLGPQQALWFTYPVGSERIRFAVQKDSAGKIRTVVASCTACYSFRDRHEFRKAQLICARCKHAMRLGDPGEKLTPAKGCVSVPVPFSTDNNLLTVRAADMEEHLRDLQPKATN